LLAALDRLEQEARVSVVEPPEQRQRRVHVREDLAHHRHPVFPPGEFLEGFLGRAEHGGLGRAGLARRWWRRKNGAGSVRQAYQRAYVPSSKLGRALGGSPPRPTKRYTSFASTPRLRSSLISTPSAQQPQRDRYSIRP